ncbi:MAG: hypothetical protein WD851_00405 [Pirellulales bacterium]
MFGDDPFFGRSVFDTPKPAEPPAQSQAPNYSGHYSSGANHSGFHNSGGSFTGYVSVPYEPLKFYDCGIPK